MERDMNNLVWKELINNIIIIILFIVIITVFLVALFPLLIA
jgi:hypothetical protein